MSPLNFAEMLALFAEEVEGLAAQLEKDVTTLVEAPDAHDSLESAHRAMHTIKGAASMLAVRAPDPATAGALESLAGLARAVEERLRAALDAHLPLTAPSAARLGDLLPLFRSVTPEHVVAAGEAAVAMAAEFARILSESETQEGEAVLGVLASIVGQEAAPGYVAPGDAAGAPETVGEEASLDALLGLDAAELSPSSEAAPANVPDELRLVFIEEGSDLLRRLLSALDRLQGARDDAEALADLRRAAHTIKGSARTVGLAALGRFGELLEEAATAASDAPEHVTEDDLALFGRATGWYADALGRLSDGIPSGEPPADLVAALVARAATPAPTAPAEDTVRALFLEEERRLLDHVNDQLVALERSPRDTEIVDNLLRATHTLEGSAATLGFERTRAVAHAMEDVLQTARDAGLVLSSAAIDLMLAAADLIDRLGNEIFRAGTEQGDASESLARLESLRADLASGRPMAAPSAAEAAPTSGAAQEPASETAALREVFLEEAHQLLESLGRDLVSLERAAGDAEVINRTFRTAHTLKGSAAMMDLGGTRTLAHALEDALQAVRDGVLTVAPESIDLMLAAVDALGRLIGDVEETGHERPENAAADFVERLRSLVAESPREAVAPASEESDAAQGREVGFVRALVALEPDPAAPDARRRFSEAALALAGSAAARGDEHVARLAAAAGGVVEAVAGRSEPVSAEAIEALNEAAEVLGALAAGTGPSRRAAEEAAASLAARLDELRAQTRPVVPQTEADEAEARLAQEAEAAREERRGRPRIVEVDLDRLNQLMNLAAELVISRTRLGAELERLGEVVAELSAHGEKLGSLKGRLDQVKDDRAPRPTSSERVLASFSDAEFDRFSDIDVIGRDLHDSALTIAALCSDFGAMAGNFDQNITRISTIARDLHDEVLRVRMVRVERAFTRIPRIVRDAARSENRQVDLVLEGADTEMDKNILDAMNNPLLHILRNAVSHGIEPAAERRAKGKAAAGRVTIRAAQDGDHVVIEVSDDGRGIDPVQLRRAAVDHGLLTVDQAGLLSDGEAVNLIFEPGFSSAEKVSELSGRGVGLDIVRSVVNRFNGTVSVETAPGRGTTFRITLPVTLAIGQALLVELDGRSFAIPLSTVDRIQEVPSEDIAYIKDKPYVYREEVPVPLVLLGRVLGLSSTRELNGRPLPVVLVRDGDRQTAFAVDRIIGQEDIVIKTLGGHLRRVPGISGATILGDGTVVMILNVAYFLGPMIAAQRSGAGGVPPAPAPAGAVEAASAVRARRAPVAAPPVAAVPAAEQPARKRRRTILVADDSISIRKYLASVLERAGYGVVTANDGADAWQKLQVTDVDLVMSDLEMPRMHGYELIAEIRKSERFRNLPVVFLTARAGEKHRRMGVELGATAFLNKPFSEPDLLRLMEGLAS